MDAIKKFLGIQQTVTTEPLNTEAPPEQTAQQTSSTGIASVPDAFENYQAPDLDLTPLNMPITTPGSTPQTETVDASSLFDSLTSPENPTQVSKVGIGSIPDSSCEEFDPDEAREHLDNFGMQDLVTRATQNEQVESEVRNSMKSLFGTNDRDAAAPEGPLRGSRLRKP